MTDFGENLKLLRKNSALSQSDLAEELNVSRATIKNYEASITKPDIDFLILVSDYFSVTIDFLLGRVDVVNLKYDYELVNLESIGDRLRKQRELNNITQQEVADYLKVNRVTYTNYEGGRTEPNYDLLKLLSKLFDVSIDYLIGNDMGIDTSNRFEIRIREQRKLKKLPQKEVAGMLEIKQNTYSDWETGKTEPNNKQLIFLSRLFHKSVDYLLGVDMETNIFTERLVELRKKNHLTQSQIADLLSVNRGSYSNWELGNREPNFSKLIELPKILNTTPNYLLVVSDD